MRVIQINAILLMIAFSYASDEGQGNCGFDGLPCINSGSCCSGNCRLGYCAPKGYEISTIEIMFDSPDFISVGESAACRNHREGCSTNTECCSRVCFRTIFSGNCINQMRQTRLPLQELSLS